MSGIRKNLFVPSMILLAAASLVAAQQAPSPAPAATTSEHVKRAAFTTDVVDREPVDEIDSLSTDWNKVYFFTEIVGLADETVTHRWTYDGETRAEVPFSIGGPRWRVYSSKDLVAGWTGTWKVAVVDEQGSVLDEQSFVYHAPEE